MKSRRYAIFGCIFALFAVVAIVHHAVAGGIFGFLAAIACGVKARREWKGEEA